MQARDRNRNLLRTRLHGRISIVILVILASVLVLGFFAWLFIAGGPSGAGPSKQAVSATAEAVDFATAQAERKVTREAANARATGFAEVTATAVTRGQAAAASGTSVAATVEARATAEAPPTLTARAVEFETARREADTSAQALDIQATRVFGPKNGKLEEKDGGQVSCDTAGVALRDFVVEARFHNPTTGVGQRWDYGIIFSNSGDATEYRMILDSRANWTLNLHSDGYDISNRDGTGLLNVSPGDTNDLKLYVTEATALLYINGQYVDTLGLEMFGQGPPVGTLHDVSACAGISKEDALSGASTEYEGFTVWSLP